MAFEMLKSIVGRRLGLSSTGGIIQAYNSSGKNSTDFLLSAQMWGDGMLATASSSGAVLKNAGVNVLSSATSTAYAFSIAAPVKGVSVDIISRSSATTITLDTNATTVLFFDSTLIGGTTGITLAAASTDGGMKGGAVILRGVSATDWQIMQKPKSSTAAL